MTSGPSIMPENQTVGQFLNYWLGHVVPNAAKPKTEAFYRYIADGHLIPSIGKIQIQKLTAQHVQALLNEKLVSTKRNKKPIDPASLPAGTPPTAPETLSPRSVRHIHRTLCTALEVAVRHGTIQRNVALLVDPPRVPKAEMKFLAIDQARVLLAAAASDRLYALYATILSLGLRLGEALGLTWHDVDFRKSKVQVRRTLQRVKGVMTLIEPKTDGSHRTIDLPAVTLAALREHQIRQGTAEEWAGARWKGNSWDLVFTSTTGTPLDERGVLRHFQERILKDAKLPKIRIHDLRHSAVAILLAQGVDARSISELLGHSSVAFTLQVYGHLMEETKRETANKMDSALGQKLVAPQLAPSAIPKGVM